MSRSDRILLTSSGAMLVVGGLLVLTSLLGWTPDLLLLAGIMLIAVNALTLAHWVSR